jgi:hypothetical protein
LAVTISPCSAVVKPDPVPQQQLRESVPATHQIDPDLLTGADQVPQRFLLIARHPHRVQLPREQQPHDQLRVAAIGLHPVPRRPRNLRRCRHDTLDPTLRELASEPVPRRTGASYATRTGRGNPAQNPAVLLTSAVIAKNLSSPVSASSTAATIFVACTSKPTRDLAFAMAGSSNM